MSLFFYGDYEKMIRVRDDVLIPQMHYVPCCALKHRKPADVVTSPDGKLVIQYCGGGQVQVEINDEIEITLDGRVTDVAKPYLDRIVRLLEPTRVLTSSGKDVTLIVKR